MKILKSLILMLVIVLSLQVVSFAGVVSLRWDANTETDLDGYSVHYGTESEVYTNVVPVGNVTDYELRLNAGVYFIAVTAEDTNGNVSDYSHEIRIEIKVSQVQGLKAELLAG